MYAMARFASRFGRRLIRRSLPKLLRRRRPVRRFKKTQNKVHSFIRWSDKDTDFGINANKFGMIKETGNDQHFSYEFRLSNLTNVSDFTNLYDMYKINKIQLILEPLRNSTSLTNNVGNQSYQNRKLRVVHDYNDNLKLTDEDDYLEYSNCKSYSPMRTIKITLYPKVNNTVEGNDGLNAYTSVNSNKIWLNMATPNVPHFGLKVFVPEDISNVNEDILFRVRAKYHISLKNSK